jgi:TolB-like protein/DNA-binding winged helix-turn-helix (wHTH) protein/Tfp pilus assembly protein PilF
MTGNAQQWNPDAPFELAGFRVQPASREITGDAGAIRIETKSMQVLLYLARNAGRVVSRAELEARVWPGRVITEDALTNAIRKLRRAFNDNAREPSVIETVPKSGYRLIAAVTPLSGAPPAAAEPDPTASPPRRLVPRWGVLGLVLGGALALVLLVLSELARHPSSAPRGAAFGAPTVAVLAFRNLGASPEHDYLANGITADLVTDLSRVSGLSVLAPRSAAGDPASDPAARRLAAGLGADYVLSGSVQRAGPRLRVNVQLTHAEDGRAVWGERFEGVMQDVFGVQDALTGAVIDALQVELVPGEAASLGRPPSASVEAYDLFLRGIEAHGRRTAGHNRSARALLERAIALDPAFARAYAGLALTHARDAMDGWADNPAASLERAAHLAEQAVLLESSLPQVHFARAQVDLFRALHEPALRAAERALRIEPNYADAHALSAWILNYAGRPAEAMAAMQAALRLNPQPSGSYLEVLGEIEFAQGRLADAAATFRRVLEINPNYLRARMWLAATLARAGAAAEAEWEVVELKVQYPGLALRRMTHAFPFRDPGQLERLLTALRSAGLRD